MRKAPTPSPLQSPVPSNDSCHSASTTSTGPLPSTATTPSSLPSPVPSDDSCHSASTTDTTSDTSSQSTSSSTSSQHNGPRHKIAIRKLKKTQRLRKSRRLRTKLLYNHYVGPGDGWTFLGSSDPSNDPLDASLPSPSSIPIHHLKVPPSYDVLGSQDPFDFLDPDASVASDECSSSCVSPIDDDASSVSTVQHANTASEQLNNTPREREYPLLLSPSSRIWEGARIREGE